MGCICSTARASCDSEVGVRLGIAERLGAGEGVEVWFRNGSRSGYQLPCKRQYEDSDCETPLVWDLG